MFDKLRMAEWFGITIVLLLILAWTSPAQIPVFLYKVQLVTFFAFLGYWIDRRLFPTGSPSDLINDRSAAMLRRAIVVAAVVVSGALAL
jgi:uncharacterized membrane protein